MTDKKKNSLKLSTALMLFVIGSSPAFAQDAAQDTGKSDQGGIDEIVVTAQKRAERAQDVPIAISVFSGSAV